MLRLFQLVLPFFVAVQGYTACNWGLYGEHCNLTCPQNCARLPPFDVPYCNTDTGKCSEGCQRGWHGDLCNQDCSRNCLEQRCNHQTGHCTLGCSGTNTGFFCDDPGECGRGWYGDLCQHPCSINCVEERCNHATGACILGCNGTYTGEFCNNTKAVNSKEEANSLAAVLVIVFLTAAGAVIVPVKVFLRWRREQYRAQGQSSAEVEHFLPESSNEESPTNRGVLSEKELEEEMRKTANAFVATNNYGIVKLALETHGHVTMGGVEGEGKKDIALKLGKEYRDKGYELVYVVDILKLKLQHYFAQGKKMCFIFHDVLRTLDLPKDKAPLQNILQILKSNFEKRKTGNEHKLCAIFTVNTYKGEIQQLGEAGACFFSGPPFVDFNLMSLKYTLDDKKAILEKHCKDATTTLDVEKICGFDHSTLGFIRTCKLFPKFQQHGEEFFKHPFYFLQQELKMIIDRQNDQSAALILMFLCQGSLNLRQVETRSENQAVEDHLTKVRDVVQIRTRAGVANAVRQFPDGFLKEGDITTFAHQTIYDACACALFSLNPSIVLEHCHIAFLNEHVQCDQYLDTSTVEKYQPSIHVSHVYTGIIEKRRASGRKQSGSTFQREDNSNAGVMSKELLAKEIAKIEEVFVKTENFRKVRETLEKHGHVTMSGAAGGGKKSIALMLGKHYQKEGFKVVHVVDASKFKLDDKKAPGEKVCFVFHDISRTIDLNRDIDHVKSILGEIESGQTKDENRKRVRIMFTLNTYDDNGGRSLLGDDKTVFFSDKSFLDFNQMSCQHTPEEKKKVLSKHCKDVVTNLDVDEICGFEQNILGFPQTCKLFAVFQCFQNRQEEFFREPFCYLREEMKSILAQKNDQSAALVLMFLCEGSVNLQQVELPSDNKALEKLLTEMTDVVEITTRTALARAVRQFRGSFFTKGDITGFAHPAIYVACACALSEISQAFVLKHCSMKFLCEHVQIRDKTVADNVCQPIIYVTEHYRVDIEKRLPKFPKHQTFYNTQKRLVDN
ncbi:uncharacterized protein LOC124122347 isoform X3 [Haliotis rufescens]|uniref:uncharacterized protein LOC124122347 isoform X3 n=1 Tax=Haliotis rufescens TaxID=6454 RepID=UPI00201F48C3|nr:uncharacterized protein LOC124122347 isoform X3 [Haliotis rufescens]